MADTATVPDHLADAEAMVAAMAAELRRMIVRCTECGPATPCEPCFAADRLLARWDGSVADTFPVGSTVGLVGRRGTFTVRRTYPDGTVLLWGGLPQRASFRTVRPEKVRAK